MRAFVIPSQGLDTVSLTDVPVPSIADGELLVRVHAVGVGIHDSYFLPTDARYPYPIGIEAAGVVTEVGRRVPDHRSGDRIAFVSSMQPKGGTWAEYVAVDAASLIVSIPAGMSAIEAAAVPVAGNTVLRALHALPAIPREGSLFIAGGSGAIGTLAIQLARARGWRVAVSASTRNHDYVRSLGAELAVDYADPSWVQQVRDGFPGGVDAAMAVQPGTAAQSMPVVRDGGAVVAISGDTAAPERGVHVVGLPYEIDVRDELAGLMSDIAAGRVQIVLEHVYLFEQGLAALEKVRTRRARGKVVLQLIADAEGAHPLG